MDVLDSSKKMDLHSILVLHGTGCLDVFERFFGDFDKHPSDYYSLDKLNPAYSVYFGKNDAITIENSLKKNLPNF